MRPRLALHTWTLDSTPLADAVRVVKQTGWDGIELRRIDFRRAEEAGQRAEWVLDLVRAAGVPVACVGVEFGWMWADGAERQRLLTVFDEQCRRAAAVACETVMSPVDKGRGELAQAAASVREVGDIAAAHGVRLALEFNSQCDQINTLARARELLARAAHPSCGLLLDTYHLGRSGATLREVEDVTAAEIAYIQLSDPPARTEPGKVLDRLPPGQGTYPFREFFAIVAARGYTGFASYEAPNEAAWKRDAVDVAREAIAATRAVLPAGDR
jgi:sugar phosphate isomerase/epimerase